MGYSNSYYSNELENTLEKAGLLIYEHLTPAEIEQRYFKNRNDHYHAFENTNIVLAVKK
jgi:O-methyltransferase involved in polyketide biosynthesis